MKLSKTVLFLTLLPLMPLIASEAFAARPPADPPYYYYAPLNTPEAQEYKLDLNRWCADRTPAACVLYENDITTRYQWKNWPNGYVYKARVEGLNGRCGVHGLFPNATGPCPGGAYPAGRVKKMRLAMAKCPTTDDYPQGFLPNGKPNATCPSPLWWNTDLVCVDSNWDSYTPDDFDVVMTDDTGEIRIGYPVETPPHCQNKANTKYKQVGCFAVWDSDSLFEGLKSVSIGVPGTQSNSGLSVSMSVTMKDPSTANCDSVTDFSRSNAYTVTHEYIDHTGRPASDPPDYIDDDGTQNWDHGGGYEYSEYRWKDHNPQPWPIEEPGDPGI